MPDIDVNQIEGDISYIGGEITNIWEYVEDLWEAIEDLSAGGLSGCWESGGDHSTCYGSDIGNSSGTVVIDLDNQTLESNNGYWYIPYLYSSGQAWFNDLYVGTTHFDSSGFGVVDGTLTVNGYTSIGCGMSVAADLTLAGNLYGCADISVTGCASFGPTSVHGNLVVD